jgi:hypothetical protein
MYILTDYRLILTKDRPNLSSERAGPRVTALALLTDYRLILTKDRPNLSSERAGPRVTALARTSSNSKLQTRPLVRECAIK